MQSTPPPPSTYFNEMKDTRNCYIKFNKQKLTLRNTNNKQGPLLCPGAKLAPFGWGRVKRYTALPLRKMPCTKVSDKNAYHSG